MSSTTVSGPLTSTGGFVGAVTGAITGNVTGNLSGNVTGNVTGNVSGDVTGNVTGNVSGNVTGNLTGGVKETTGAVTADGAIAIPTASKTFVITKAGVAAMTLANPTATTHDGVKLTFVSATANAHTLDNSAGAGFNAGGAGGDVGTFSGAIGDGLILLAYQGVWYVLNNIGVTIA